MLIEPSLFAPQHWITGWSLLIAGFGTGAALGVAGMLGVFGVVLIQSLARGLAVDCGCFAGGTTSLQSQLAFDLVLAALLLRGALPLFRRGAPSGT